MMAQYHMQVKEAWVSSQLLKVCLFKVINREEYRMKMKRLLNKLMTNRIKMDYKAAFNIQKEKVSLLILSIQTNLDHLSKLETNFFHF